MRLLWIKKDQAKFRVHICGKIYPRANIPGILLLQDKHFKPLQCGSDKLIDHFTVIKVT